MPLFPLNQGCVIRDTTRNLAAKTQQSVVMIVVELMKKRWFRKFVNFPATKRIH